MSIFPLPGDLYVLIAMDAIRTVEWSRVFIWVSEFGSETAVIGITAIVSLLLALRSRFATIAGLLVSVGGAGVMMELIKRLVARPRPSMAHASFLEPGFAFPSGHATESMALYGFLFILALSLPRGLWWRVALIALPCLIAAITFSRLYLGVHYLSDVVAGAALGAVFVRLGVELMRRAPMRLQQSPQS